MTLPDSINMVHAAFIVVGLISCIFFVKSGYKRGVIDELKKLAGIVVALICIFLILVIRGAVADKQYSTVIVIGGALFILSIGWKGIRMILGLLSGIGDLPVIGLANRLLGAALGAAECAALFFVSYKLYEHFLQI